MVGQYPFFVYGTLIPGQPNDFYWEDCIGETKSAVFPNGRLFDMGSFPMLIERGRESVIGQVMVPHSNLDANTYQLLVQRLDNLENYNPENVEDSPYYRALRTVFIQETQPTTAWVYLGRPKYTQGRTFIRGGNWVEY
ncbi:MAG: gamma-glutamylcyclotransferase family protein, partial [Candidatus Promineifilaceae bacterium]